MKYRKAKIDSNQKAIVAQLRLIPGVTVEPGHDDILVGYKGKTYWIELKAENPYKADGKFKKGMVKDCQIELLNTWQGHYAICWSIEQILEEIGVSS